MAINPLAIGGGVVATAAVVGGGLYAGGVFSGSDNSGKGVRTPTSTSLTSETLDSETGTDYSNGYANSFKKHFVSTTKQTNKAWWDDVFTRLLNPEKSKTGALSDQFKAVTKGFGNEAGDATTSLNKVCETAFKKSPSELKTSANTNYVNNIWNFCSVEQTKLDLLAKDNGNQTKIKGKHGDRLVDTDTGKNNKFWEIQEEAFFGATGLGSGATEGSTFKTFYNSGTKNPSNYTQTLRDVCKTAYEKDINASDTKEETDVLKFCAIRDKEND